MAVGMACVLFLHPQESLADPEADPLAAPEMMLCGGDCKIEFILREKWRLITEGSFKPGQTSGRRGK